MKQMCIRDSFAPYVALLQECCQLILDPGQDFGVDKCLMLYKGRLHFQQYMKDKEILFWTETEVFCLCPRYPKFQGYTWNCCLYSI